MGLFGSATKVKDPVCGMQIIPSKAAATATHDGKTYRFCSKNCHQKFTAAPQQYA